MGVLTVYQRGRKILEDGIIQYKFLPNSTKCVEKIGSPTANALQLLLSLYCTKVVSGKGIMVVEGVTLCLRIVGGV